MKLRNCERKRQGWGGRGACGFRAGGCVILREGGDSFVGSRCCNDSFSREMA